MSAKKKLLASIAQAEKQVICQRMNHAAHKRYFKNLINQQTILLTTLASSFIIGWVIGRGRKVRASVFNLIKVFSFSMLEKAIKQ